MAIVSNKLQTGVDALYDKYFKEYLSVAIGAREGIYKSLHRIRCLKHCVFLIFLRSRQFMWEIRKWTLRLRQMQECNVLRSHGDFEPEKEQEEAGADLFVEKPEEIIPCLYF